MSGVENLRLLLKKTEQLCARCERLQREITALRKDNLRLNKNNKDAKRLLGKMLERLPDYTK